jgi:predicted transcriptional regulator
MERKPEMSYAQNMPKPVKTSVPDSEDAEFLAAVDEGLADADAGRLIPYQKIRRWLLSWGTENELPPPE